MDERELAREVQQIPDRFADRLDPRALAAIRSLVSGGEWQEALDVLVAALTQSGASVTEAEKDALRPLLRRVQLADEPLDQLKVSQQP